MNKFLSTNYLSTLSNILLHNKYHEVTYILPPIIPSNYYSPLLFNILTNNNRLVNLYIINYVNVYFNKKKSKDNMN